MALSFLLKFFLGFCLIGLIVCENPSEEDWDLSDVSEEDIMAAMNSKSPEMQAKVREALGMKSDYYEDEADGDSDSDFGFVEEEEEEEYDMPDSYFARADFLQSSFVFPETHEGALYLGEENEVLIGLTNTLSAPVNISLMRLSILHPMDSSYYYLQNCTIQQYYQTLAPRSSQTFLYKFVPDVMLQPREYVVVLNVYFEGDNNRQFYYQPVNVTHDFIDAPNKLDTEIVFMFVSIFGVFGAIIYLLGGYLFGGKGKRRATSQAEASRAVNVHDEWVQHLSSKKKGPNRK